MYCKNCGAPIQTENIYCGNCGKIQKKELEKEKTSYSAIFCLTLGMISILMNFIIGSNLFFRMITIVILFIDFFAGMILGFLSLKTEKRNMAILGMILCCIGAGFYFTTLLFSAFLRFTFYY